MKPTGILKLGGLCFGVGLILIGLPNSPAIPAAPNLVKLFATATGAEIQEALDRLPPNGELLLGPGTYEIRQPLTLRRDSQTLRGSGPATVLHLADRAGCPVVILGPQPNGDLHLVRHLRLADLLIDGNRQNQPAEFWRAAGDGSQINNNGVQIWNAADVAVQNVVCCHCRSGGLVSAGVERLLVRDFAAFDNQFDGLACYQTMDSHFAGLRLHDNVAAGISLDLAFNRNLIEDADLTGNDLGIFMRDSRDNSFKGVTIDKCRGDGVFIAQATELTKNGWQLSPGTQCVGNIFSQLEVEGCGGRAFQVNDASCTGNVISDARFHANLRGGLSEPSRDLVQVRQLAIY
jgi:hypothetical protein